MIKDLVESELAKILQVDSITLLTPKNSSFGDFALHSNQLTNQSSSLNIEAIVSKIADNQLFKSVTVEGGFINLKIKDEFYLSELKSLLNDKNKCVSKIGKDKRVIVEYSSINIAKPFTIGHLRSTIIGDAIANLLEATGHTVYRDNHVGDWGTQFGKQILAIKKWGDENEIETSTQPLKLLVGLYIKFHDEADKDPSLDDQAREWFSKLENNDVEARRLWKKCVDWSWTEFDKIYKILNVRFTENDGRGYGESYFEKKISEIIALLEKNNLLTESEGAKLVFFPQDEYPPLMIVKKDGATLYSTRELATDYFRLKKYGGDISIINEVGAEQSLYFQQLFEVENMLGWFEKGQRIHIKHGMYRFKDGKMSTRKGNIIWLEDVLSQAIDKAEKLTHDKSIAKEVSKIIGIGALKWNDLKRTSSQDVVFDWEDILNMSGNSGPYIQYTYARIMSVLNKSGQVNVDLPHQYSLNELERSVLVALSNFQETINLAALNYSPHLVCNYLNNLSQDFNHFYEKCPILDADTKTQQLRLSLSTATANIIKQGLNILGIQTADRI